MRDNFSAYQRRVWRVTHFGAHVFTPTLIDMPTGHYWAYVEREQAKQMIERRNDVTASNGHCRGWAGVDGGFMQAMERQLWQQHSCDWLAYRKSGEIISKDTADDPKWAELRLRYIAPTDTAEHLVAARVEISHRIETEHATALDEKLSYAQYWVAQKEEYLDLALQRDV